MNIISKLMTAVRGGVNDIGESLVDVQALRILDQEIRDADEELKKSREALASMMARQKIAEEAAKGLNQKIEEYEGYALKALEKGDEQLGLEVAAKIANLEAERNTEEIQAKEVSESVTRLRRAVNQAESNIDRLKQQIDAVKATESLQQAQLTVARRQSGSSTKLQTALESLERIKKRQEKQSATLDAYDRLSSEGGEGVLEDKLRSAGIIINEASAETVLARLKEKRSEGAGSD